MRKEWMRRAAVAAALTTTLALAAPARASGPTPWTPGPGVFHAAWQWIAQLWVVPDAGSQPAPRHAAGWTKNSGMVDPDGSANSATAGDSGDKSSGVDPDG